MIHHKFINIIVIFMLISQLSLAFVIDPILYYIFILISLIILSVVFIYIVSEYTYLRSKFINEIERQHFTAPNDDNIEILLNNLKSTPKFPLNIKKIIKLDFF